MGVADFSGAADNNRADRSNGPEGVAAHVDRLNAEAQAVQKEDLGRAIALAEQALAVAEAAPYPAGAAESQLNLGFFRRSLAQYERAAEHLLRALAGFESLDLPLRRLHTLNNLTPIYGNQGDYATALKYALEALALAEETGQTDAEAEARNNIGFTYVQMRAFDQALPYLQTSLAQLRASGNRRAQSFVLDSLCQAYRGRGDSAAALAAGLESVALAEAEQLHAQQAEALVSVGVLHLEQSDPAGARSYLNRALTLAEADGFGLQQLLARRHLSAVHAAENDLDGALAYGQAALALAERLEARPEIYRCHEALAALYKRAGDYGRALAHHEQFHAVHAQVFNEAAARREAELFQLRSAALEREIQEREHVEVALRAIASTDALTGLATRRHFFELAEHALAQSHRYQRPLTVLMLDVDRLKHVNDQHGHAIGDEVLRAVGQAVRQTLRAADLAGRYGGDELAMVLPETSAEVAASVVGRLHATLREMTVRSSGTAILLSVSVGLASTADAPELSLDALLDRADRNMYTAKHQRHFTLHGPGRAS